MWCWQHSGSHTWQEKHSLCSQHRNRHMWHPLHCSLLVVELVHLHGMTCMSKKGRYQMKHKICRGHHAMGMLMVQVTCVGPNN